MFPYSYVNGYKLENITRPNNTTAYAATGQAINDNTARQLVFPVTVNKRGAYLTRAELVTNSSAHTGAIRLHLFANAPSIIADQASLSAITYANGQDYEGFIDFTTFVGIGGFAVSEGVFIARPLQVQVGAAGNNLYGILEARAAFTPVAQQQFGVQLYSEYSA